AAVSATVNFFTLSVARAKRYAIVQGDTRKQTSRENKQQQQQQHPVERQQVEQEAFYRIVMVASAALLYLRCALSAARVVLRAPQPIALRQTLLSAGLFAMLVVGCLMLADAGKTSLAAGFSAAFCVGSLALLALMSRHWKRVEDLRAQTLKELSSTVHDLRRDLKSTATPETLCAQAAKEHDLTRREEDMLLMLCQGCSYAEIATELYLSPNTVKSHIRSLYRKMGVEERANLAREVDTLAQRRGSETLG
ncbi:MAG: LuxR C-terminal-related transcriptional regulator, partial [Gordonibacter sp.]